MNYTFVLRFELILTIRLSMPSFKGLLDTQLFVTGRPLHWMVASRQQRTGRGVSVALQCSCVLLMVCMAVGSEHAPGNLELEMKWSGMMSEALYLHRSWKTFPEKMSNRMKPFISALDLLVGESTCPQVEGEAPEIHMTQLCVYR